MLFINLAGEFITNIQKSEQKSRKTTTKKLEISVVEGSFRRIAGIREFADKSGTFLVRVVEILREPGKSLGFYIQQGDGWERSTGIFVSRVNLGSIVETNGLLSIGDEITKVNDIDVTQMPLKNVAVIMRYVKRLFLTIKVLTSPTLVRTGSLRRPNPPVSSNDNIRKVGPHLDLLSHAQPFNGTHRGAKHLQHLRGAKNTSPLAGKIIANRRAVVTRDEGPVPYAYTRIGGRSEVESSDTDYATVGPTSYKLEQGMLREGWISTESFRTLGSRCSEELDVNEIDCEYFDQSLDTQQYCGQLTVALATIDNLIPSDGASLVCSISVDSELTVEVTIPASQLEQEVKIDHKYHIQLSSNCKICFSFVNGILSSEKAIPLSYFIPTSKETHPQPERVFALTLSPIGRLRLSLGFCPLPAAIPRWANPSTTTMSAATLRELVESNPNASGLPLVVERAIRVIQEYGIETVSLYQMTASEEAKSQAFNTCLSQTLHPSQLRSLVSDLTVHAFTGVLKDVFLKLPKPIFDNEFSVSLQDALQLLEGRSGQEDTIPLSSFIECLPEEANTTTCALLTHFKMVCQHGPMNRTTIYKISQVFAPLLFTPAYSERDDVAQNIRNGDYSTHVNILKALILQHK